LFRLLFNKASPVGTAKVSAPSPGINPAAAESDDTDRLAIERGENEGMADDAD